MRRTIHLPLHIPTLLFSAVVIGLYLFLTQFVLAHGGDTNLIHACVKTSNPPGLGSIRLILPNSNCNANETAVDWNKLGAPGLGGLVDNLVGGDFTNADFRYRNLNGRDLSATTLTGANFQGANLINANISNISVTGLNFSSANLTDAILQNGGYANANFNNAVLDRVNATNSDFTDANLNNAQATGANFSSVNFTSANLQGATTTGSGFTGVTWVNTVCPDGTNSDNNGNTCEGHLTP